MAYEITVRVNVYNGEEFGVTPSDVVESVSGEGSYSSNEDVTVTFTPKPGYRVVDIDYPYFEWDEADGCYEYMGQYNYVIEGDDDYSGISEGISFNIGDNTVGPDKYEVVFNITVETIDVEYNENGQTSMMDTVVVAKGPLTVAYPIGSDPDWQHFSHWESEFGERFDAGEDRPIDTAGYGSYIQLYPVYEDNDLWISYNGESDSSTDCIHPYSENEINLKSPEYFEYTRDYFHYDSEYEWISDDGTLYSSCESMSFSDFLHYLGYYDTVRTTASTYINLYVNWTPNKITMTYSGSGGKTPSGETQIIQEVSAEDTDCSLISIKDSGFKYRGYHIELDSDESAPWFVSESGCYVFDRNSTTFSSAIDLAYELGILEQFKVGDVNVTLCLDWIPNRVHLIFHSSGGVCIGDSPAWDCELEHSDSVIDKSVFTAADTDDISISSHIDEDENYSIIRSGYTKQYDGWDVYITDEKYPWDTKDINYILYSGIYAGYFELCDALGVSYDEHETTFHLYIPWLPIIYGIHIEGYGTVYYHYCNSKIQSDGNESFFYKDENLQTPIYKLPVPIVGGRKFVYYGLVDTDGNFINQLTDENGTFINTACMMDGDFHAKICWEYLASMYAKAGNLPRHGLIYVKMADGTYKVAAGAYVKVDDEWKISIK